MSADEQSAKKISKNKILTLPEDAPASIAFFSLQNEVQHLHITWALYEQVFMTSRSSIENLNEVAGTFFSRVQTVMIHDMIMTISRPLDPPVSGRDQRNIVLEDVISYLPADAGARVRNKINSLRDKDAKGMLAFRNKSLAHADQAVRMGKKLPGFTMGALNAVIKQMAEILNEANVSLFQTHHYFDLVSMPGDGGSLNAFLKRAIVAINEKKKSESQNKAS